MQINGINAVPLKRIKQWETLVGGA